MAGARTATCLKLIAWEHLTKKPKLRYLVAFVKCWVIPLSAFWRWPEILGSTGSIRCHLRRRRGRQILTKSPTSSHSPFRRGEILAGVLHSMSNYLIQSMTLSLYLALFVFAYLNLHPEMLYFLFSHWRSNWKDSIKYKASGCWGCKTWIFLCI